MSITQRLGKKTIYGQALTNTLSGFARPILMVSFVPVASWYKLAILGQCSGTKVGIYYCVVFNRYDVFEAARGCPGKALKGKLFRVMALTFTRQETDYYYAGL